MRLLNLCIFTLFSFTALSNHSASYIKKILPYSNEDLNLIYSQNFNTKKCFDEFVSLNKRASIDKVIVIPDQKFCEDKVIADSYFPNTRNKLPSPIKNIEIKKNSNSVQTLIGFSFSQDSLRLSQNSSTTEFSSDVYSTLFAKVNFKVEQFYIRGFIDFKSVSFDDKLNNKHLLRNTLPLINLYNEFAYDLSKKLTASFILSYLQRYHFPNVSTSTQDLKKHTIFGYGPRVYTDFHITKKIHPFINITYLKGAPFSKNKFYIEKSDQLSLSSGFKYKLFNKDIIFDLSYSYEEMTFNHQKINKNEYGLGMKFFWKY